MFARKAIPRLAQIPARISISYREYSTTELSNGITLAYDVHEPTPSAGSGLSSLRENAPPILFIHGLFGSKKNNRSMTLARDLKRPVYAMDMRNHGDSSHNPTHDYNALAEDVELFLQHHNFTNATLIGHSMGAKTVEAVALRKRTPIANIIPVDNAPVDAQLGSAFGKYVQGLLQIDRTTIHKQSDADRILEPYEPELVIRQFLLGNLVRRADGTQTLQVPIKILANALDNMADFPFRDPDEVRWEGPVLMVRGTKSRYVADEMLPVIGRFFPNFERVDIESGHWVTSEKPEEFRRAVVDWLQDKE